MAAAEKRVGPLQENHTPAGRVFDHSAYARESLLIAAGYRFRLFLATYCSSHFSDVVLDLIDRSRGEKKNFGLQTELSHRPSELVPRRCAHATEILRQYHIRTQIAEEHLVDGIERIAAAHSLRDGSIDRIR
jgi:hypothetical protein